jgi:hypothetical protein
LPQTFADRQLQFWPQQVSPQTWPLMQTTASGGVGEMHCAPLKSQNELAAQQLCPQGAPASQLLCVVLAWQVPATHSEGSQQPSPQAGLFGGQQPWSLAHVSPASVLQQPPLQICPAQSVGPPVRKQA